MLEYDVVISFAGEDRAVAEIIARHLVTKGLKIFYDEYEQTNLWGKDLYTHLSKIYKDDSKYCLMLLSESYAKKQWTSHERRAAQARAFSENQEYILPLRLDDTSVEGILDTTGYIDYRRIEIERLINIIVEKVRQYNQKNGISYEIIRVEDVLKNIEVKGKKGTIKDKDITTHCPTCETTQLLSEAPTSLINDETIYTCKNGCQPLLVVSRPGVKAWDGRGYRIDDFVIGNAKDLIVKTDDMELSLVLSARKSAFMKVRPTS